MSVDLIPNIFLIIFAIALVAGPIISFISQRKLNTLNALIAEDLGWSYGNFVYDDHYKQYIYFIVNGNFGITKCFTGTYEGLQFTLIESKYLMVEFENLSHKFYGVEILSKNMAEFTFKALYSKFRYIQMDSEEFNKIFHTYQLEAGDAYYDLPPNAMATIIDLYKNFKSLAIEAKKDNILIYFFYPLYYNRKNSKSLREQKQQMLLNFISEARQIQKALS